MDLKEYEGKKVVDVFDIIANKNNSNELDEALIQQYGRVLFPKCVVVCWCVYPYGKGKPFSIHQFAKELLKVMDI